MKQCLWLIITIPIIILNDIEFELYKILYRNWIELNSYADKELHYRHSTAELKDMDIGVGIKPIDDVGRHWIRNCKEQNLGVQKLSPTSSFQFLLQNPCRRRHCKITGSGKIRIHRRHNLARPPARSHHPHRRSPAPWRNIPSLLPITLFPHCFPLPKTLRFLPKRRYFLL